MGFAERVARVEGWGLWESTHYRVLALFCVGVMVSNFSTGMVAAMLTIFQSSFKFTAAQAGGLVSINLAAGALVSPLITWSVLRPARLKLMGLGFLFAAAFSVLGARSTSFTMLAFAQLGMGAGTTFVSVYGPPLLTVVAPASACTKYVGAFFLAVPIGSAIGLLLGGAMVERDIPAQSFRYNFWIFAALSAVTGIVSMLFGHIRPHPDATEGRKAPPTEPRTFWQQMRLVYRHPLFDLLIAAFGLAGFIIAAYGSFLPQFVEQVYRQNIQFASTVVGITIAPSVLIGIIASSLVADRIVRDYTDTRKRFKLRVWFLVGVVSIGVPIVGGMFYLPKLWLFLVVLVIALILVFCVPSPAVVATLEILNASERTHGMGWVNFYYSSLGAIPGPLVLGKLLDVLWDRPRQAFALCGIAVAGIWGCLVAALVLSSCVLGDRWFQVTEHEPHPHPEGELAEIAETVREAEQAREAEATYH